MTGRMNKGEVFIRLVSFVGRHINCNPNLLQFIRELFQIFVRYDDSQWPESFSDVRFRLRPLHQAINEFGTRKADDHFLGGSWRGRIRAECEEDYRGWRRRSRSLNKPLIEFLPRNSPGHGSSNLLRVRTHSTWHGRIFHNRIGQSNEFGVEL